MRDRITQKTITTGHFTYPKKSKPHDTLILTFDNTYVYSVYPGTTKLLYQVNENKIDNLEKKFEEICKVINLSSAEIKDFLENKLRSLNKDIEEMRHVAMEIYEEECGDFLTSDLLKK